MPVKIRAGEGEIQVLKFIKVLGAVALIFGVFASPASSEGRDASAVVRAFQAGLLETMKQARTIGVKARYENLSPVIEESFHLPLMIATASSPFWRTGTPEQKQRLVDAFHRMSASSVATLFDGYGGETFRVVRERQASGPTVLVDTQIVRPKDDPIDITYVSANLRGRWWIIDIIIEGGISEVKVRRNEYRNLLKDGGLDRLAGALDDRAKRLLSGKATVVVHR